jgi:hypothetical protein
MKYCDVCRATMTEKLLFTNSYWACPNESDYQHLSYETAERKAIQDENVTKELTCHICACALSKCLCGISYIKFVDRPALAEEIDLIIERWPWVGM